MRLHPNPCLADPGSVPKLRDDPEPGEKAGGRCRQARRDPSRDHRRAERTAGQGFAPERAREISGTTERTGKSMLLNEEDIGQSDDKVGTVGALAVGTGHGWAPLEPGPNGYVLTVTAGATTRPFDPNLPPVLVGVAWAAAAAGMVVGNPVSGGSNNAVLTESGTGNLAALA